MTFSPTALPRHERFSFLLFFATVAVSLSGILGAFWWIAPDVWVSQFTASIGRHVGAFLVISLVICFVEYFFHRYILHTSAVPFLRRFYRQHTRHHALTRIIRKPLRAGQSVLSIENKFPIVHEEQHESAFFPWYTLAAFGIGLTPLLVVLHLVVPGMPWFLSGYLALVNSLILYEVLHAINHWPLQKWEPLITHPRWGWFWQPIYGFHLRHHAVIDCNESISGFFGLPLADWLLGTCVIPKTVYAEGEEWTEEKFRSPQPCGLVRGLDALAHRTMLRRRSKAASPTPSA